MSGFNTSTFLKPGFRLSRATDWNASLPKLNLFGLNQPDAPITQAAGFTPSRSQIANESNWPGMVAPDSTWHMGITPSPVLSAGAPLAAPTASAAAPTFASVPIGGWQGRTNISNNAAQLNALNAMENIARSNAGILAGGVSPYGDYGEYATPQSILAMQGTST